MFTGIIESVGTIRGVSERSLEVESDLGDLNQGDSIAVNGVCLTIAQPTEGGFSADLSEETIRRSNFGFLMPGAGVNLERAVPASGRFGGHFVQGHVDGTAEVVGVEDLPGSRVIRILVPDGLARYLVEKGSVAVDGVSLTVAELRDGEFTCALIPHTLQATTLKDRSAGDIVNIEVDLLAKYVESLTQGKED